MKRILMGIVIVGIFITTLLSYPAGAQEGKIRIKAETAVILFMEGEVKVKTTQSDRWVDAAVEMILSKGDNLKTGVNSWAEIGFGKDFKNAIRVKEMTLVEFIELGPIKMGLLKGEVRSLVERLEKDSTFEIKTPTAVCGARGTGWDTNTDGRKVVVDAYEEEVYFNRLSEEGSLMEDPIIEAGKRGLLEDPAQPITIGDLPIDRMRDWQRWKEDFTQRRSAQRGVEKTIEEKVAKMDSAQKTQEEVKKQKESMDNKRALEKMEKRIEATSERSSGGYN